MAEVAGAAAGVAVRLEDDRGQARRLQPQRGGEPREPPPSTATSRCRGRSRDRVRVGVREEPTGAT
ncbi:hypothetical protein ACFQZ4_00945 [Catellatospora coxensis]